MAGTEEAKSSALEPQFLWVTCGKVKQIYNLNCQCHMLLDAIQKDMLPKVISALESRKKEIGAEITEITRAQEEDEAKQRAEAAEAEAKALTEGAATSEEELSATPTPGKGAKPPAKKPAGKDKGKGDKESDEKSRQLEKKREEEEARKALAEKKAKLVEEQQKHMEEIQNVKLVNKIDLFDSEGSPCSIRNKGGAYASMCLGSTKVYTLVKVEETGDGQVTQTPIEVSL